MRADISSIKKNIRLGKGSSNNAYIQNGVWNLEDVLPGVFSFILF